MKRKLLLHSLPLCIILGVVLIYGREFFLPGVPQTHDSQYHIGRVAAFFTAVKDGHIPPRWGGFLNVGFGYPVFNFNYPLGNMLGLPYLLTGFSVEQAFKLIYLVAYLVSGVGYYVWLSGHFRRSAALFGTLVFMIAPFQFLNMFVRGAFGEVQSLAFFPWVLVGIDRLIARRTYANLIILSLAGGLWLMSHNVSVFILALPVLSYVLIRLPRSPRMPGFQLKPFLALIGAGLIAVSLSLWFWLPALLEKKFTILETIPSNQSFTQHYPTLGQLLWGRWGFGLSVPGPGDGMSFALGEMQWVVLIASLAFCIIFLLRRRVVNLFFTSKLRVLRSHPGWADQFLGKFRHAELDSASCAVPVVIWAFAVWLVALFFMSPASSGLASHLPLINYIQHPWRLLQVTTLVSGFLAAYLLSIMPRQLPWWMLLAVCLVLALPRTVVQGRFTNPDIFYYRFPLTTSGEEENMPIWFNQAKDYKQKESVVFAEPNSIFEIDAWKTTRHLYRINASKNTRVAEHTAYFPGWKLYIDGRETPIDYQHKDYPGLISYFVQKGDHTIETKFTDTPVRQVADYMSLAGSGSLLVLILLWQRERLGRVAKRFVPGKIRRFRLAWLRHER